ncbi:MAG: site-2 protease family protein [Candidatus Bathyarchaeota archaeon]|nr:site-2 protease family protein [Candidatus Bathyarchaeota archaeon]
MVESEFNVEEGFIEHGVPTFYVRMREDSKEAFLRLTKHMESVGLIPVLRRREEKIVLRTIPKPSTRPSRNIINIVLFFATLGTVFLSGYLQSPNIEGAVMFTGAIVAVLGSHEMGHKLIADKHAVEATYPYFIPGLPPIGTFGAVIQQKSLPPNKDALFDVGATGPIAGFIVAVVATIIGLPFSTYTWIQKGEPTGPLPLLIRLVGPLLLPSLENAPPSPGLGYILVIVLHPIAFAGWVGMIVTMLNLVPVGMFDGGHVARSLVGKRAHRILSYLGIILLLIIWYPMAFIALFFSFYQHPGPLDDVSQPTTRRKLAALGLIAVFILCVAPIFPLLG